MTEANKTPADAASTQVTVGSQSQMSNPSDAAAMQVTVKTQSQMPPDTRAIVESQMPDASVAVQEETTKLLEAMKTRALSDMHSAGEYTREKYLALINDARTTLENEKLFDPERLEYSAKLLQYDIEKNWDSFQKQIDQQVQEVGDRFQELGDRLSEAATAAWNVLTAPRPSDRDPNA